MKKNYLDIFIRYFPVIFIIAILPVLYFGNPSTDSIFPPCPTHYITDLHCPGCGTLRAIHALVHLEFKEAISKNVLTVICIPLVFLMTFFPEKFRHPIFPIAFFIIIVIFTIVRNLECGAFLAPSL